MNDSAPAHRIEYQLQQTAKVLDIHCQIIFIVKSVHPQRVAERGLIEYPQLHDHFILRRRYTHIGDQVYQAGTGTGSEQTYVSELGSDNSC